jgi:phosphohistidine phosphatase
MAKRRLLLLRHAKSSWDDPGLADRERPLAPRGRRAAAALRARLARRGPKIDRVLCSPSQRTRETLALLELARATPVAFDEKLYLASAEVLLARIHRLPARARCVLVIAHDPGLDHLVRLLAGGGRPKALRRLSHGFATGALAELRVPAAGWSELAPGSAFLDRFLRPKDVS